MTRVVVTGMGLITPLGVGLRSSWANLIANKSGLVATTTFDDYEQGWSQIPSKVVGRVPVKSAGGKKVEPKGGENGSPATADRDASSASSAPGWCALDHMSAGDARRMAPFAQYAVAAAAEALADAQFVASDVDPTRVGVAVGSGIGGFGDAYDNSTAFASEGYRKVQPLFIPRLLANMAAGHISIRHGFGGPVHAVLTACATGLNAIGDAYNFIQNGYADVMVCGGTEASLHPLALGAFARARSVVAGGEDDPQGALRPFDGARRGFVLGEGCGILVLEKLAHAQARGAPIYGEVLGYGLAGDAHHITAPAESGDGAFRAMEQALLRAGVAPSEVDYVNAHATLTPLGDRAENTAMRRLFGLSSRLAVSLTKGAVGHLLGAAGAVEAAFTLMAVRHDTVPATLNLTTPGGHPEDDPSAFCFDYVPNHSRMHRTDLALCNSFGFGGVNTSVLFGKMR